MPLRRLVLEVVQLRLLHFSGPGVDGYDADNPADAANVVVVVKMQNRILGIMGMKAVGLVFLDERFAVDDEDAHLPGLDRGAGVHVDITPVAIGGLHAPAVHGDDAIRAA